MKNTLTSQNLHDPVAMHLQHDLTTLRESWTVGEALAQLRTMNLSEKIIYFYVVDQLGKLVGVVPTRRLLMSGPEQRISALMVNGVVAIPHTATVLEACEYFTHHRFLAFPVVNDQGHIQGVVDINLFTDETITVVEQEQAERAFQLIGVHVALGRKVSPWISFKDRFPWLLCNIGGGIICAMIAGFHEALLDVVVVLALFIPIVLALAESVSMQSMTLTLVGLEQQRMHWARVLANLRKEFATAVLLGAGAGFVVGLTAYLWRGNLNVSAAVGGSICLSMISACLLGVAIPTLIRRFRGDPRIAAGPVVLASADIATLILYFNLSAYLLT